MTKDFKRFYVSRAMFLGATMFLASIGMASANPSTDTFGSNEPNPVVASPQQAKHTIKGVVEDQFGPIAGANVVEKGTTNGTITDMDGNYRLNVTKSPATLQFSYIGMTMVEKQVTGTSTINVTMENATQMVDEVVVVAYGVKKKGTIAGSVSVVKGDKIENTPTASFDQALQGKSAGLTVLQNTGEPSAAASFQIRGTNSINAGTAPLFIMDGVAISADDFSSINPNDIESFTVLKDASSTSIYGARAANGVIVITTKRGRTAEKGKIILRAQYGFSDLAYGKWDQMNTTERLNYEEQIGLRVPGTYDREALERIDINWRDVIYNNNAPMYSYELSTSGGSNKFNYFVSAAYFGQEGIAVGSDFERYSVRANLEVRPVEWLKIGTNTSLSYEKIKEADEGDYNVVTPVSASKFMLPYWNPYREDGSYTSVGDGSWNGTNQNPLEWLDNNPVKRNRMKVLTSLFAELRPIEGLVLRTVGGLDASDNRLTATSNPSYVPNYGSGTVAKSFERYSNLTWTNTANYTFTIKDDHNISLLLGQEAVINQSEGFNVTTRGQSNDKLLTMATATSATSWDDIVSEATYLSFFGRAEYNYSNKYYADFSVRRDGSSKFGKDARWANFWSVGAMWNLKSEDFLKDIDWLTNLQLIASIGTSGNSSIPNYDHTALFAAGPQYSGKTGIAPYSRGNENLTWEKLMTTNIGVKIGLFDRLNLNVEFYNKKTTDMLMEVPVTFGNGFNTKWDNIGAMINRGVEFDVDADIIRTKDFTWNVSANASYNHNEIIELYNGLDEYEISTTGLLLKVGHSYGEFHAVRYAGVNPANGDALWYTKDGELTNRFSNEDRVLLGKSYVAPWQGGFGTTFSYKGIQLSALFSWVADRWMMNNDRFFDESNGTYAVYNQSAKLLNRWQKPGDITEIPRDGVQTQLDSHLVEDASFMRLKNLSLSYTFPQSLLKKTKVIERAKVFGQAQNLLTFTKFTGLDPESNLNMYRASYPLSRQFSFGIEVTF